MINVSISRLVNQIDESHFTLYTEWQDTYFKIILLQSSMVPLSGEMHRENAKYFLDHLGESFDTYLKETKQAFSGENVEIQFFLQDDTFSWKQQNILTRGEITIYPLSNILIISDILKEIAEHYQKCQKQMLTLEKENKCLNKTNTKLITDLEEMINIKNTMEKNLYKKFILLLNTKKKKIRELQAILDNKKQTIKTIYDKTTDESEDSDIESKKAEEFNAKSIDIKKHKMDLKNGRKFVSKNSETEFERYTSFSFDNIPSPQPSTSKDKLTLQNIDTHYVMKSKQLLSTPEEESEEDLFA